MIRYPLLLTLSLVLSPISSAMACSENLGLQEEWIAAPPAGSDITAAYMHIQNKSDKPLRLLKAHSDCCDAVEVHTNENKDGVMQMRPAEGVEIPAKGEAVFESGGTHIMLIGLKNPLKSGDKVTIGLTFDDGETISHAFPVKSRP